MPVTRPPKETTPVRRRRSLASLVGGLLLAIGLSLGGAPTPAAAYDEGTIVALANDARAANGLGGLVRNGALDSVALNWANQMAASGTLSHNPSVGQQIPGGWTRWGENIAQGYGSGAAVHEGWMNSSGHRANILGSFTDIGVALIQAGGTTWAVQVFATYAGSGLPAPPAPAPPAPAPAPAAPAPAAPPTQPQPAAPEPPPSAPTTPVASPTPVAESTSTSEATPSPTSSSASRAAAEGDPGAAAAASGSIAPVWPLLVAFLAIGLIAVVLLTPLRRMLRLRR